MANLPFQSSIRPDSSGTFTKGEIEKAREADRILQEENAKKKKLRDVIRVANNKPRLRN